VVADEIGVGEEAVDGLGPEALVRMEDEPRRVLLEQLRGRGQRGRRRNRERKRREDDGERYPGVE